MNEEKKKMQEDERHLNAQVARSQYDRIVKFGKESGWMIFWQQQETEDNYPETFFITQSGKLLLVGISNAGEHGCDASYIREEGALYGDGTTAGDE